MRQLYNKSTRELFKDFIVVNGIEKKQIIYKKDIVNWFQINYPKTKKNTVTAHIRRMTTNVKTRFQNNPAKDGSDDLFFELDNGKLRLYEKGVDPMPFYFENQEIELTPNKEGYISNIDDDIEYSNIDDTSQEFAFEQDLKNFLSKNLHTVELGLILYESNGINGIEYNAGGRFIDILAMDKDNNFVVIELKVSTGSDKVIGQLLRYIGWIKSNLSTQNQKVRGIIIARKISEDLKIACSVIQNVKLYEYSLSVTLKTIDLK